MNICGVIVYSKLIYKMVLLKTYLQEFPLCCSYYGQIFQFDIYKSFLLRPL